VFDLYKFLTIGIRGKLRVAEAWLAKEPLLEAEAATAVPAMMLKEQLQLQQKRVAAKRTCS